MSRPESLSWDAVIPPFDLLKGTIKVFAIAGVCFWLFIEAISLFSSGSFTKAIIESISQGYSDVYYAGGFIGCWLLLSFLACWCLFRNGYPVSFSIQPEGVVMTTQPRQRKINRIINMSLFWLSLFSGRPGGMGTALLAEAGQSSAYSWTEITKISLQPNQRIIKLKSNWRTLMALYCMPENYDNAADLIVQYYNQYEGERKVLAESAPDWKRVLARLLVYPVLFAAAALIWFSPLLSNPHAAILLAIAACSACASQGDFRIFAVRVLIAAIIGVTAAMIIGAFEPLGDMFYFRYYRYDRLDRMPYIAEFIGSLVGLLVFCLTAWLCVKSNRSS